MGEKEKEKKDKEKKEEKATVRSAPDGSDKKDIWKNYVWAWSILTHYSMKSFWQTVLSPFSNL